MTHRANVLRLERALPKPRNITAATEEARRRGSSVVVSFVGTTQWLAPHCYVDSGRRYDWSDLQGLHPIIAVKPGVDAAQALREIHLQWMTTARGTSEYPVLVDVERQDVACVVNANPLKLWQIKRQSPIWRGWFAA